MKPNSTMQPMLIWIVTNVFAFGVILPSLDAAVPSNGTLREKMLDGPLAGVEEIVFATRVSGRDHWYVNFGYYSCDYGEGAERSFGMYPDGETLRGYGDCGR